MPHKKVPSEPIPTHDFYNPRGGGSNMAAGAAAATAATVAGQGLSAYLQGKQQEKQSKEARKFTREQMLVGLIQDALDRKHANAESRKSAELRAPIAQAFFSGERLFNPGSQRGSLSNLLAQRRTFTPEGGGPGAALQEGGGAVPAGQLESMIAPPPETFMPSAAQGIADNITVDQLHTDRESALARLNDFHRLRGKFLADSGDPEAVARDLMGVQKVTGENPANAEFTNEAGFDTVEAEILNRMQSEGVDPEKLLEKAREFKKSSQSEQGGGIGAEVGPNLEVHVPGSDNNFRISRDELEKLVAGDEDTIQKLRKRVRRMSN